MHHPSPSAITYPSPPSSTTPPHCPTTYPCPTPLCSTTHLTALPPAPALLHPALPPTSQPYDLYLPYSIQLYCPSHYPTPALTICPTPPSPATYTRPTPLLGYLS